MAIEAIGSSVQAALVKSEGLQNLKNPDISLTHKNTTGSPDLPAQAVKGISPAEEEEKLRNAADKTNEFIKTMNQELQFSVDKDTEKMVVKVVDKQTGDVIRQIPPKEMLEIAKALDTLQGLIIRKKI